MEFLSALGKRMRQAARVCYFVISYIIPRTSLVALILRCSKVFKNEIVITLQSEVQYLNLLLI